MTTQFTNLDATVTEFPNTHGYFYADKTDLSVWAPFTGQQRNFDRENIRVEYFIKDTLFIPGTGFLNVATA